MSQSNVPQAHPMRSLPDINRRTLLMGGAGLVLASAASGQEIANYRLSYRPVRHSSVEITHFIECKDVSAQEWLLYVAHAPILEWEHDVTTKAELVTSTGVYPFAPAEELSEQKRPVWRLRFDADKTGTQNGVFSWKQIISATISSVQIIPGTNPATATALSTADRKLYLRETETYDFSKPEVQRWLDQGNLHRRNGENALEFGYRVYTHMVKTMPYDVKDGGRWIASQICKVGFGECCRHSIVATSAMRANGIPARSVCALWAKDTAQGDNGNGHVWPEFYVAGIGWVPMDTSRGVLRPTDFFGFQPGELIAGMIDFDYLLDTVWHGNQMLGGIDAFAGIWMRGQGQINYPPKFHFETHVRHLD